MGGRDLWAPQTALGSGTFPKIIVTVCRCMHKSKMKLYHAKRTQYINWIQKHCCPLWSQAHLRWTEAKWKTGLTSQNVKFFLEIMIGVSFGLKRTESELNLKFTISVCHYYSRLVLIIQATTVGFILTTF